MSFSLAAPLSGLPCLWLVLYSGSPGKEASAADWITAISTTVLALIGLIAYCDYRDRKKKQELLKLDDKVLWWFLVHPVSYAIKAPDLAANLGHTLQEITDSLKRLSIDGKIYTQGGEVWLMNRATIFGQQKR